MDGPPGNQDPGGAFRDTPLPRRGPAVAGPPGPPQARTG